MQKKRLFVLVIALALLAFGIFVTAQEQEPSGNSLAATLTGGAEVPGPGDPDGSGTAKLTLNPEKGEVCFELAVSNIQPATGAHIHEASADKAGPVKVGLRAPENGTSKECVSASRELITEIIKNPANYYVNVHNAEFKAGAVRGQLSK